MRGWVQVRHGRMKARLRLPSTVRPCAVTPTLQLQPDLERRCIPLVSRGERQDELFAVSAENAVVLVARRAISPSGIGRLREDGITYGIIEVEL